jgi:PAS domain S-box-containing protein
MSNAFESRSRPIPWKFYSWLLIGAWTAVVTGSLLLDFFQLNADMREGGRIWARTHFDKDVLYRRWNAAHGGVYVQVSDQTPPNPYLSQVPERDVRTPSGRLLTLINPAYMTRQVHELARKTFEVQGHITSLRPIRPENRPDAWETAALQAFEGGKTEVSSVEKVDGKNYLRLMRPLVTEKGCLSCHTAQEYKVGDIRGGISMSVPLTPLWAAFKRHVLSHWTGHIFLWLFGVAALFWGGRRLGRSLELQGMTEQALQKSHDELELRVEERTTEITKANEVLQEEIAERQLAEQGRRESEQKYRLLVSQIPAMVFQGYGDWSIDPLDDKVEVLTGYSREDFLSRRVKWCDLIPAEDLDYAAKVFIEALKTDKSYVREHRLRKKDGEIIWVQCRGQIFLNDQGKVDYISGVSFDVTQRRQAEEAVREGERFLADIFASIQDGINIMDTDYNILRVNPTFERWFDHARPLVGKKCYEAFHGRQEPCEICPYRQTMETGKAAYKVTPRNGKDGADPAWMEIFTFPITDRATGQVKGVIQHIRDITERQRAEAALRESEVWLKTILDNVQTGILIIDPETKVVVDVNPAAAKMIGTSKEQIVGSSCQQNICPAEKGKCPITDLTQVVDNSERLLIRADGERRNIIKTVVPATLGGRTYFLESFIDITERQKAEAERAKLESQLRQAVKMEAVGRLAGGVAHDFNNILTAITGYGELLLMNLDRKGSVRQDVKDILVAAERAASLTRQLLAFSRKQVLQPQRLDLNRVVGNMDKMLRRIIGEDIELVTVLGPELGTVTADPGQIEQVIMNLAVNARDAMPQGGKLTIETADADLDEAYAQHHLEAQPGPYVMLAVSDTGVGLDQEAQARIFEPFFTTKELGKGTGLGLSTVYGIVKQSGGLIWVYSEPGKGTTFKIYLPRLEAPGDVAGLSQVPGTCDWGSETILLVEDEDMVRQVARRILARHGYSVLEAASGDNALVVSREHAGPIHLMLTDVVMPGMSGQEIMENLKSQRPEMKVLFMSGHTENAIVHHGVLNPGTAFIQKPFKYNILAHKIREMLDNPAPG